MGTIRIDDGTKEYRIVNRFGKEICKIHFRPTDLSLLDRYQEISKSMESAIEPLKELSLKADGTTEDESWEILKSVENSVIEKFGELLDTDDVSEIFKTRRAFSSVGGRFFCEIVLLAIGEAISEEYKKEAEETSKRISKYMPPDEDQTDAGAVADNG